jgi:formate/nitrite transporter FocA (FNT family)
MSAAQREEEGASPDQTLEAAADEGTRKVERTVLSTLTAGLLGGAEIALGVLALLAVLGETGEPVLAAIAFTVGYVAITLSGDELFTEGFLIPIAAVVRGPASWLDVLRLWSLTLLSNLAGGWLVMFLVTTAYPDLLSTSEEVAGTYLDLGVTGAGFAAAVLAGLAITLLTWIHKSYEQVGARLVSAIAFGFLLAVVPLNHGVVASLEMFAAILGGGSIAYSAWAPLAGWAVLGNLVGGLLLVTVVKLVEVRSEESDGEA